MRLSRLVSLAGLCAINGADGQPLFVESTVRGWMHSNLDGFRERCVVRLGQRVTVDLDALEQWLEERRGTKTPKPTSGPPRVADRSRRPSLKSFDQIRREAGRA